MKNKIKPIKRYFAKDGKEMYCNVFNDRLEIFELIENKVWINTHTLISEEEVDKIIESRMKEDGLE